MSDLATLLALTKTSPQLPIPWYFDPQIYALEQKLLFERGPGYVGHELMTPNRGDYQVLARFDNGKALVRGEQDVQLISNVCRHRQAVILKDRGSAKSIVCPLHRGFLGDADRGVFGSPLIERHGEHELDRRASYRPVRLHLVTPVPLGGVQSGHLEAQGGQELRRLHLDVALRRSQLIFCRHDIGVEALRERHRIIERWR